MKIFFIILLVIAYTLSLQFSVFCHATDEVPVFTYRAPESDKDLRYEYDTNLLRLALETTVESDGPYRLVSSPRMNYARAHSYLQSNKLANLILKLSYDPFFAEKGFDFVNFPVDLGIVGYRICFAHPETVEQLLEVDSIEELRKFTHGQGAGWADVAVLRYNNFDVSVVPEYESLFKMVAARRFDLFCRGANELHGELSMHQNIQNLSFDKSMIIFYPFPRFFYSNAANTKALDRIERGLLKSYKNGSMQKLWLEHYGHSIEFVGLDKRKIFTLKNPLIEGLKDDYKKYFYSPNK